MDIKEIQEIKPLFTSLVTTATIDSETKTNGGILLLNKNKGSYSLFQKVIFVSDFVKENKGIKVGDIVHINPIAYGKPKYKEGSLKDGVIENNYTVEFNIPTIIINNKEHLFLQDRDIDFIVTKYKAS